jgi:D-lactate dehydrogenase
MKIVFFEVKHTQEEFLRRALDGLDVAFHEEKLSAENIDLARGAEVVSLFTNSMVNQTIIDNLPDLRLIVTRSTGFDHIDLATVNSKNIKVSNVPAYGSETVAEFTFALMLTLSRKIREASMGLKENGDYSVDPNMQGFDLSGKTLGVVGTGKIGKNVIHIAHGFNMNVIAYDLYPDLEFAKKMNLQNNFSYKSLPEVLSQSDIVTLHAPCTKENHHLINKENISLFKKGAYLINTARGDLVDNEALRGALLDGLLKGAGLDVLEGERDFVKGDVIPFLDMPNVIMTPHVAFDTVEAENRILQTTVDNIQAFISGDPINLVK